MAEILMKPSPIQEARLILKKYSKISWSYMTLQNPMIWTAIESPIRFAAFTFKMTNKPHFLFERNWNFCSIKNCLRPHVFTVLKQFGMQDMSGNSLNTSETIFPLTTKIQKVKHLGSHLPIQ